jgi:hypothetical protein
LSTSAEFGLTAIDAKELIKCDKVGFAYKARTVKATKGTAIDGWRDILCREGENKGVGLTLRETLPKVTLFGRNGILILGARVSFDMDSSGRM